MIFPYTELSKFLNHAKNCGQVTRMCDTTYSAGEIVLRHDVDLDILPAYNLSKLESTLGIRSTFFILTSCHSYNPASRTNREMLREMTDSGFEIGLHFDPSLYGDSTDEQLEEYARIEANLLEVVTGKPILSVSIHTPSIHGKYPFFSSFRNAYDPRIFSDEVYMSDSRMNFRGKDPFEFVTRAQDKPIQILLHPMHFTNEGSPYPEMFHTYIKSHINVVDDEHRSVNSGYTQLVPGTLLSSFLSEENKS